VKRILDEFKAFAFRGNVIELAVAVILGLAFYNVVSALVSAILMPLIAAIFGEPSFDQLTFGIGDGVIAYGRFLTALVDFVLIAFALFVVVKAVNQLVLPGMARPDPPKTRACPHCLTMIPVSATRCSGCTSSVEPTPAP
jgi:large conductance mechanosensitive channel